MTDNWRLVQIFMGSSEDRVQVYEVLFEVGSKPRRLRCSCPGWKMRHRCVHVEYVYDKMTEHLGYFPALATPTARETLTPKVLADADLFRKWIYDNAHVVVIR